MLTPYRPVAIPAKVFGIKKRIVKIEDAIVSTEMFMPELKSAGMFILSIARHFACTWKPDLKDPPSGKVFQ
jgi:hypothetical protein